MGSIDQPPAVLGGMIGSALVGTFLGVLLAYGIVSPLASRLEQIVEEDGEIYHVAKAIIISSLFGNPQPIVIEAERTSICRSEDRRVGQEFVSTCRSRGSQYH